MTDKTRWLGLGPWHEDNESELGSTTLQNKGSHGLLFSLHGNGVFEGSGHNICTAADNSLKRTRAALEVNDLDVQTFVLEITELFCDGKRQIVVKTLTAHGNRHVFLFRCLLSKRHRRESHSCSGTGGCDDGTACEFIHFYSPIIKKARLADRL